MLMNNKSVNHKHRFGNPNRNFVTNRNNLFSYPSDDLIFSSSLASGHFNVGGLLPLYNSFPPANLNLTRHLHQPPHLPLPIHQRNINMNMNTNMYRSNSCCSNNNNIIRSSPPRINKGMKTRVRDQSLTPKKSKNHKKNSKCDQPDPVQPVEPDLVGPDPKDLPKDAVFRVFNKTIDVVDKFSGSVVFTPSPPPSSLPLPTFTLRAKLGCKAQAGGVDAGATDGLRRLLRI